MHGSLRPLRAFQLGTPKSAGITKEPIGLGDDVACEKCGAVALDTGLECTECGHDNYEAITGKPFGA